MDGWYKLHRQLLDDPLWTDEPFTRGQAWVDLIGLANHQDSHIRVRGNRIEVKRGQVGWSERSLCRRWKWSRGKLRRFLDELEMDTRIDPRKGPQRNAVSTVITITNYERYQSNGTTNSTTDGPQKDHRQDPNKNDKKEKNKEQELSGGPDRECVNPPRMTPEEEAFEEARRLYPFSAKRGHRTEWENFRKKHKDWRTCVFDLVPAIKLQMHEREQKQKRGEFIPCWQNFKTWINQRTWEQAANVEV